MNIFYLLYFIIKSDYYFVYTQLCSVKNKGKVAVVFDIICCSLKYGSSFEDYFIYDFLNKGFKERNSYVLTGLAHRFFKKMNDSKSLVIFKDKRMFNETFHDYINRESIVIDDISKNDFVEWCKGKSRIIAKPMDGVQGKGISVHPVRSNKELESFYDSLKGEGYLVEDIIVQHPKLQALNPTSVNSIRVITINISGEPKIIAAILRIGCGGVVDNFSEGGIAAPVGLDDGIVFRAAISRGNNKSFLRHPNTKVDILGFEVPNWDKLKDTVISAAKVIPSVRTVGWDIAITEDGIDIIEGNDNWNKNIYQLTYGYGRKEEINNILKSINK